MPTVSAPNALVGRVHPELSSKVREAVAAIETFQRSVAGPINNALVLGDTLQLFSFTVAVPTDWVAPASLAGGWVNFGSGNPNALYRKGPDGRVDVIGILSNPSATPTVNTDIFVLPAAYIPDSGTGGAGHHLFAATTQTAGGDGFASMDVHSNGGLRYRSGYAVANGYLAIDTSYMAAARAPIQPSCYPINLAYTLPRPPIGCLVCSAVDQASPSSPSFLPQLFADWTVATVGQQSMLQIRNIPGLIPTKTYVVTLAAFCNKGS